MVSVAELKKNVLRSKEAAAYIGVCQKKLYTLVKEGRIAYISDGDRTSAFRFLPSDLDAYLQRNRVSATG